MIEITHCPQCSRKLSATIGASGRTELACLRCDKVDPLQTEAAKRAQIPLANPPKAA